MVFRSVTIPWSRHTALVVILIAALAACDGAASGQPTPSPTNGPDPATLRYSCGGSEFLADLFERPAIGELENHPSSAALRDVLAGNSSGMGFLPDSGWWLVGRDDKEAQYVVRLEGSDSPFAYATLQRNGVDWALSEGGHCLPQIVLDGLVPAIWTLSPAAPAPGRGTVEFTALVTDLICTGGQAVGERLVPPVITYTEKSVFVVFSARPFGNGLTTCQGKPSTEVTVRLREPLGDRVLLDAGVYPPADPADPARLQ